MDVGLYLCMSKRVEFKVGSPFLDVLDCKFVQKWAKEHIEAILPEFLFCNSCEVFHDYGHIHFVHGSSQLCELLVQVDAHSNLGNLLKAQGLTHRVSLISKIFSD